jgi:hypothetical protein
MNTDERSLLLRALSERIPYQTAIEPLDGTPGGILKCTDWEGHVWITGHDDPYDVEEVRPLLREFKDLPRDEVTEIFKEIVGPDITTGPGPDQWFFTEDGLPICENEQYSLFFAPDIIDIFLNSLRARWVDTQGLISKKLAFKVDYYNNPYMIKNIPKRRTDRKPMSVTFDTSNWRVLPLKK